MKILFPSIELDKISLVKSFLDEGFELINHLDLGLELTNYLNRKQSKEEAKQMALDLAHKTGFVVLTYALTLDRILEEKKEVQQAIFPTSEEKQKPQDNSVILSAFVYLKTPQKLWEIHKSNHATLIDSEKKHLPLDQRIVLENQTTVIKDLSPKVRQEHSPLARAFRQIVFCLADHGTA